MSGPTNDTGVLVLAGVEVGGMEVFVADGGTVVFVGIRVSVGAGVFVPMRIVVAVAEGKTSDGATTVARTSKIAVRVKFGVGVKKGVGADNRGRLQAIEMKRINKMGKPGKIYFFRMKPFPPQMNRFTRDKISIHTIS